MAERFRDHLVLCAVIMVLIAFGGILPTEAVAWLAIGGVSTFLALGLDWIIQRLLHSRKRKTIVIGEKLAILPRDFDLVYMPERKRKNDEPEDELIESYTLPRGAKWTMIPPPPEQPGYISTVKPKIKPKPTDTSYGTLP